MHDVESSCATANMLVLPSWFFRPAIPVIFEDPSSIAIINSFAILLLSLSFQCSFLADNLVVKLQIYIAILVPSGLGQSIAVKFLQSVHLLVGELGDQLFPLLAL